MRVPITRIIVFGGLYWGPPILVNYQLAHVSVHAHVDLCL